MTYKEKILSIFPNARFRIRYGFCTEFPTICPYDLGLIKECEKSMRCDTCGECWELEAEEYEQRIKTSSI